MNIYCAYHHHSKPILMGEYDEKHLGYMLSRSDNINLFDGVKEVNCLNCGKSMAFVVYDDVTGKIYELSYQDSNRVVKFKYDRIKYVYFGDKYYARLDPAETKHIQLQTSLSLTEEDTMIQSFIDKLEQRLLKLENFK